MSKRVLSQAQVVTQQKSLRYILIPILPSSLYCNYLTAVFFLFPTPCSFLIGFICLHYHHTSLLLSLNLTFILLMWTFGRAPNNASKWQTGFNSIA